ncbi:class A beta-lactamase-related serine hydrolase [Nonomuraea mesophila]|uniref:Class A beta-lactamase-related serine hydrolase n=1 Tax=Nonomuraea mesophila TaxID=2530382 RepID=A0A4R5FCA0_9ACTN|nr:serine hydrolase domain-containing protein [Nonomuraea mesophila]TDE46216.1 class A beta-lactamase-related serine hydrolase [Nonomuraea mesophila]
MISLKIAALSLVLTSLTPNDDRLESLERQLDNLVKTKALSAALVRVSDQGKDWTAAAGYRDTTSRKPADPAGHFRIGSVTKTFVATVALQLADEGKLKLDDRVSKHLPGALPEGSPITVRQLLGHSSGLFDYAGAGIPGWSLRDFRPVESRYDQTPEELLAVGLSKPPYFKPGQGRRYSNTNYVVAAMLIEKLTGRPYADAITSRILRPLRLTHTSLPGHRQTVPRPHARGYVLHKGKMVDATRINPSLEYGAGEMISTTADLSRFLDALLGGKLTSASGLKQMRATRPAGDGLDYGLGLQKFGTTCGKSLYGHSGAIFGYLTYALRSDDGRTLVLSGNPYSGATPADALQKALDTTFC